MYKGKNVLVAGGTGFVGVNLIRRLLELGADVTATIHKKEPVLQDDRIRYVRCDLTRQEDCHRVAQGMDFVFMCAANTSGAAVIEKNPLTHVTPNVIMNLLILEAAYSANVKKVLFISSNTVYPAYTHPVKEEEMMTGDLFEKYFCVGWMKRFSEIACEMYATKIRNPMQVVVVRPANIYGEYDDFEWETSHVLPALIRKVVERHAPLEVWGDGKDLKDFIYVGDFVEGILSAMEKIEGYEPVNIGSGRSISIREALQTILAVDGYEDAQVVYNQSKPSMIPVRKIDVTKAEQLIGFSAETSFEEGIRNTIRWYRQSRASE
ncbi:NAD-dependent epimerase/dehydratase family protein [Heliobacterium mobile]|uniref:NAD-dependent epimerase/dehydratase family protein n=1 Tax=Heliobacterium mobile TaxID=28064 RepID=UPI0014785D5E|nr:NAD-dependent epimerase/dehydratase family protein [Heliobacterium mobile]